MYSYLQELFLMAGNKFEKESHIIDIAIIRMDNYTSEDVDNNDISIINMM
jgi:hypothetical protein